jgi:drug/metabolite transporter (DMT)-like permease
MTRDRAVGWLVVVAVVWGASFTLIKQALASMSPLMFMGLRFAIATALIAGTLRHLRGPELRAGLALGALFSTGFAFQTAGLELTTPSRSAFITSLSSALTPAVALVVHRVAPGKLTVWAIVFATAGMYLLTAPDGGGMNAGDALTIGCAVIFAGHIVAVAHFARRFDPMRLLAVQLGLTALLSFAAAPLLETPRVDVNVPAIALVTVLALTGLWSFYMQLRAQREVSASDAALIFMLEPVFATAVSFAVLGERFTPLQWAGGTLILAALAIPVVGERVALASRQSADRRSSSAL